MAPHPDHQDQIRRFGAHDFARASLRDAKESAATTVTVCLPARDEGATVGAIVRAIHDELAREVGLVDEILVVDDHSTDDTADAARTAGARVVDAARVLTGYGTGPGKGGAMWKGLHEASGDLIVWCDADVRDFSTDFVVGLLGPLLTHPDIAFVKGYYDRPVAGRPDGARHWPPARRPARRSSGQCRRPPQ